MREAIDLGDGVSIYADAKPPFTICTFSSGFSAVLDSLGRNLVYGKNGGTLFTAYGAEEVAKRATEAFSRRKGGENA